MRIALITGMATGLALAVLVTLPAWLLLGALGWAMFSAFT